MRARWPRQLFGLGRGIDVTTTLSDGLDGAADATVCHVITTRQCGDSRLVVSHCGKPLPRTPSPATTTTYPHPCSRSQRYKDDSKCSGRQYVLRMTVSAQDDRKYSGQQYALGTKAG